MYAICGLRALLYYLDCGNSFEDITIFLSTIGNERSTNTERYITQQVCKYFYPENKLTDKPITLHTQVIDALQWLTAKQRLRTCSINTYVTGIVMVSSFKTFYGSMVYSEPVSNLVIPHELVDKQTITWGDRPLSFLNGKPVPLGAVVITYNEYTGAPIAVLSSTFIGQPKHVAIRETGATRSYRKRGGRYKVVTPRQAYDIHGDCIPTRIKEILNDHK